MTINYKLLAESGDPGLASTKFGANALKFPFQLRWGQKPKNGPSDVTHLSGFLLLDYAL